MEAKQSGSEANGLARAITLTALAQLKGEDAERRRLVFQFLRESNFPILAGSSSKVGANLGGYDLRDTELGSTDLRWADLSLANLVRASLIGADLRSADLRYAKLVTADLDGAKLRGQTSQGLISVERISRMPAFKEPHS